MLDGESPLARRVLVLMPTQKDAERTVSLCTEAAIDATICADVTELCREIRAGAGAVLLTDTALLADRAGQLAEVVRAQPAWSNLPFLVLASEGASDHLRRNDTLTNVTLVERPVRTHSLVSLLESALRGRQHQYQIRDALLQRERQAEQLVAQEERTRFAMTAGGLGSWDLDLRTMEMETSALCRSNYGRPLDRPFLYSELHESIHPDDRERVVAAIARTLETGVDYDVEYRCVWPNGEVHWVMVRGRVAYDRDGAPQRMVGVSLDISERKQIDEQLASQAEQLRDADRRKDTFLATLAHELRNPLAPIRTGVELLQASDPESTRMIEMIRRQLGHMVRLIDDLLDVSRITRGKLELKRERVALADVLALAVEASRPLVDRAGHELRITLPVEPLYIDADLTRLAQVIGNLLNNACKYTPKGGHIELSARQEDKLVRVEVRDDGIGIPPDQLEHVFEMFGQVNRTLDREHGGLGIGLALVRQLVELHGGSVHVRSDGPGLGTVFQLELPEARPSQVAPEPVLEEARAIGPRRILVVDDNEDAAEMVARALRRSGHETQTAFDGPSALEEVASWKPEVVLLDIGLPGMSGYDVARALRSAYPDLNLVALTGWGSEEDRRKSAEAGFDLHLTKPVDASQLQQALRELAR